MQEGQIQSQIKKAGDSFYEFDASHIADKSIIPYTEEEMRLSLLKFMIAKRQPQNGSSPLEQEVIIPKKKIRSHRNSEYEQPITNKEYDHVEIYGGSSLKKKNKKVKQKKKRYKNDELNDYYDSFEAVKKAHLNQNHTIQEISPTNRFKTNKDRSLSQLISIPKNKEVLINSNSRSMLRDQSHKSSLFQHYNPTSPNDYKLPDLIGKQTQSKKQSPSYSFGIQHSKRAIISPSHKQDLLGKDSPGVGYYKVTQFIRQMHLRDEINKSDLQFGTVPRFFEFENQRQQQKLPITYQQDLNTFNKQDSKVNLTLDSRDISLRDSPRYRSVFGKDPRNPNPGPGAYESPHNLMKQSSSKRLLNGIKSRQDRFDITKKVFCKEWSTDHKNKESLGPGIYSTMRQSPMKAYKIPQRDRGLLSKERNNSPSPASYNTLGDPLIGLNIKIVEQPSQKYDQIQS
ncbi:UNKNOWN [Stylonychia lemnae]|uniref:Uncharacterized protein n=1 Tax=Stylonychia lemnae TaxID=5949 RepID=A0A078B6F6_STYLE|nr:UNKNOWN [Stylonychia lemnae]|eukprot:CDW89954.1 UNKNOWN [Stylonychia lemnae]